MTEQHLIGVRLKALRTQHGKARGARATQAEVADAVGIARSTLTAYEKGHDKPGRDTLVALAGYYGVSVEEILSGASPLQPIHTTQIEVRGDVQAGVWREAVEWPRADWYAITVPLDAAYAGLHRYGLLVKGDSMNKVFPDGSVVVVINLSDLGRMPHTGEIVVAVQRSKTTSDFEATVKAVQVRDDGEMILWPQSTNPDFAMPVRVPARGNEHDAGMPDVFIQALVVASYRPNPTVSFG
ncbi:LexA family protein [Neokomagataea anthophila]|uniref:Helix-turn-helix domain-containing protein n=1 Tax=Neokomagataea anthophila TaxID=2826925 RepID=A0ABS5E850_9PROT|nr:LexA family transcriptional regulator [Neokomagataea anthophila]MBR0560072.1 helix-turn-helix domain-containing protein [Neokomagataea anthophila]